MSNVLLIGGGGREHALASSLIECAEVRHIFVTPGNVGTHAQKKMTNIKLDVSDHQVVIKTCRDHDISLVVVGPEVPLADGIVDSLIEANIKAFGPTRKAARIEADKVWAKDFMEHHGIPTAEYKTFSDSDGLPDVHQFIDGTNWKGYVVKASGLAAGKGVIVAESKSSAKEAASSLRNSPFLDIREASRNLVVEEMLIGFEVSILAFTDGHSINLMPPAQDYKKRFAGDMGPNTGGMGAFAPCKFITVDQLEYVKKNIMEKTISGLKEEGILYSGVLYAGLMVTSDGPKVLEFNCRFGDPETQVLMLLLRSNLYQIMLGCVNGNLHEIETQFANDLAAVGVNVVIDSYPGDVKGGFGLPIMGLEELSKMSNVVVFYAGAKKADGSREVAETSGGRVLSVCSCQECFEDAVDTALQAASCVSFKNAAGEFKASHRADIGFGAVLNEFKQLPSGLTYKNAGVNIEQADALIPRIKELAETTKRKGVRGELGLFGGVFDTSLEGYFEPLLISGTDGVGTKLKVAIDCGVHTSIGIDLVAMSVNDILMHGAEPLFFLDYLAMGHLKDELVSNIVEGVAKGCTSAGCALIGGETAEMPSIYGAGEYDIAGFAVGAVERQMMLPKMEEMGPGDVLIGISSSGVHSNGFSLLRRIVDILDLEYSDVAPFSHTRTLGETFLTPTFIYSPLVKTFKDNLVLGSAHITGGGLEGNIMRIVPSYLKVKIDKLWPIPSMFAWLHGLKVPIEESLKTFNLGLGVVLIVKKKNTESVLKSLEESFKDKFNECTAEYLPCQDPIHPYSAWVIGSLEKAEEGEPRFEIRGIEEHLTVNAAMLSHYHERCFHRRPKRRVAVLISGTGTNLQALLDHTHTGLSRAKIALVISNKGGAGGLEKAIKFNVPTKVIPHQNYSSRENFEDAIHKTLKDFNIDVVVLAGFMRILTGSFVRKWEGRMINIHPALLPSFKGKDAQAQALEAGVTVTGCTVHFVEEEVDGGAIIFQEAVAVYPSDTVNTLSDRIRVVEHKILPIALEMVARGKAYHRVGLHR